jgi:uncharacterized membrane protein YhaH (DUF805 family)
MLPAGRTLVLASLLWLLFDWRGRISRSTYRAGLLVTVLLNETVAYATDASQTTRLALTGLSFAIVLALEAKRFHDIGLSAAWILWVNLATVPIGLLVKAAAPDVFDIIASNHALPLNELLPDIRFLPGAVLGLALGSTLKGVWLSFAASSTDENAYTRASREDKVAPDAALADALDRVIAERKTTSTPQPPAHPPMSKIHPPGTLSSRAPQRSFGKRSLSPGHVK